MAYTLSISVSIGSSRAGLTLGAQLVDTSGVDVGSIVTSGFSELGQGNYLWTYTQFPDGFRGAIKFYNMAAPTVILAATALNPEEAELIGNISLVAQTPNEITIEVPHISTPVISIVPNHNPDSLTSIEIKTGVR